MGTPPTKRTPVYVTVSRRAHLPSHKAMRQAPLTTAATVAAVSDTKAFQFSVDVSQSQVNIGSDSLHRLESNVATQVLGVSPT